MKINSLNNSYYLNQAKDAQSKALENISAMRALSGIDGANLLIADSLRSEASTLAQGISNSNQAQNILNIGDGALAQAGESALRINELNVRANSGLLNSEQKAGIQNEINRQTQSISSAISTASYGGNSIFTGSLNFATSSNSSINFTPTTPPNASLYDFQNQDSTLKYISSISQSRADIGATYNAIQSNINSNTNTVTNLTSAESNLQNNDVADNYNKLEKSKLQEKAALFTQAMNTKKTQEMFKSLYA